MEHKDDYTIMGRCLYWRLRAKWARWRTRRSPRPSTDELLRRIYGDDDA